MILWGGPGVKNYKICLRANDNRAIFEPPIWPHCASCWLIFRSPGLPKPLLAHFWLLLTSPNVLLLIFLDFPSPRTLPEPQKSMKNHWFSYVFCYFYILLKMTNNLPKMLPKWSQKASKTPPTPSKICPRHPKMVPRPFKISSRRLQDALWHSRMHPRHAPDVPKTRQGCPRHPKTPQRRPQDVSKIRFLMIWEIEKNEFLAP